MKVRDPEGRTWRVTRRWVPWRPRRRSVDPHLMIEAVDDVVALIFFLIFGLIILPLLSIVVFFALEWLLIIAILPVVVLLRMRFGDHWWVEARLGFRPYWEESVGTWQESGARIRRIAESIERGDPPPRLLGAPAPEEPADEPADEER